MHPATNVQWLDQTPTVLIAEGTIVATRRCVISASTSPCRKTLVGRGRSSSSAAARGLAELCNAVESTLLSAKSLSSKASNTRTSGTSPCGLEYVCSDAIQLGKVNPLLVVGCSKTALNSRIHAPLETDCLGRGLLSQPNPMAQVGKNKSVLLHRHKVGHGDSQCFSGACKGSG